MNKNILTFLLFCFTLLSTHSIYADENQVITFVITDADTGLPIKNAAIDFKMCGQGIQYTNATGFLQVDVTGYSPDCLVNVSHETYHSYQFKLKEAIAKEALPIKLFARGKAYKGRISDGENDIDLNQVAIKAMNLKTQHIQKAYSNSSGIYTLYLHPKSTYLLTFSRYNYQTVQLQVETNDGTDMGILGSQYIYPSLTNKQNSSSTSNKPIIITNTTEKPKPKTTTINRPSVTLPQTNNATPTNTSSNSNTTVVSPIYDSGTGFSVQLASLSKGNKNQPKNLAKIKGMIPRLYTKTDNKYIKYRVGVYRTKEEAEEVKKYLRAMGFKGVFTVMEDATGLIQEIYL